MNQPLVIYVMLLTGATEMKLKRGVGLKMSHRVTLTVPLSHKTNQRGHAEVNEAGVHRSGSTEFDRQTETTDCGHFINIFRYYKYI